MVKKYRYKRLMSILLIMSLLVPSINNILIKTEVKAKEMFMLKIDIKDCDEG